MSHFQVNGVRCDNPGCTTAIVTKTSKHVPWDVPVEEATGWYRVNGKDYCVDHAAGARRDPKR